MRRLRTTLAAAAIVAATPAWAGDPSPAAAYAFCAGVFGGISVAAKDNDPDASLYYLTLSDAAVSRARSTGPVSERAKGITAATAYMRDLDGQKLATALDACTELLDAE